MGAPHIHRGRLRSVRRSGQKDRRQGNEDIANWRGEVVGQPRCAMSSVSSWTTGRRGAPGGVSGLLTPVMGWSCDSPATFEFLDAGIAAVAVSSANVEPGGSVEGGPVGVVAVVDDQFDECPEVAFDPVEPAGVGGCRGSPTWLVSAQARICGVQWVERLSITM